MSRVVGENFLEDTNPGGVGMPFLFFGSKKFKKCFILARYLFIKRLLFKIIVSVRVKPV